MKKIDFAIAGFQKCGTTSLHNYLTQQQGIFMPSEKEMYYYSRFFTDKNAVEYKQTYFRGVKEGDLVGFSDVDLIMDSSFLKRVIKENPKIKFIIMLRDPVERLKSAYNFEFSKCLEKECNISIAVESDMVNKTFGYVERSLYGKHLSNAVKIVNVENLLLLTLEEMKEDKKKILEKISKFLGVGICDVKDEQFNVTAQPRLKFLQSVLWNKDNLVHQVFRLLPRKYKSLIRVHIVSKLISLNTGDKKVTQANEYQLSSTLKKKYFADDLALLNRNFGISYNADDD